MRARFLLPLLLVIAPTACSSTKDGAPGGGGASGTIYFSLPVKAEIHKLDLATGADAKLGEGTAPNRTPDGRLIYLAGSDLAESDESLVTKHVIVRFNPDAAKFDNGFHDPQLSPDATRVAYRTNEYGLYVVSRADGTVLAEFAGGGVSRGFSRPTWAPDGRIVVAGSFANPGLFVTDVALTTMTRFDPGISDASFADDLMPAVSPDGTQVAFVLKKKVYLVALDGTGLRELDTDDGADDTYPTWSPDGAHVAYFASAGHLMIRPAAGGDAFDVLRAFPDLADKITIFERTVQFDWK